MAMYHLSVKYVSRNQGRSSVGAAAYRAGELLHNDYDGQTHDFTHKRGIAHTEIMLPKNAPPGYRDRQTLWNAVEKSEKRSDARTAREIELALPNELPLDEQIALAREFIQDNFISAGMCADLAIHSGHKSKHDRDGQHEEAKNDTIIFPDNPHAHILLTVRPVDKNGFTATKTAARVWNKRDNVNNWREAWAKAQNREFERKGLDVRVSHESHAKRGIEREPTKHLGHEVTALERRGIRTGRGDENRDIEARNRERDERDRRRQQERERGRQRRPEQPAPARSHDRVIFQQPRQGEYQPMAQSSQQSGGKTAANVPSPATPSLNHAGSGHSVTPSVTPPISPSAQDTPPLSSPMENDSHNVRVDIFGFGYAGQGISDADGKRQEQEDAERKEREQREREERERKEREEQQERRRKERERRRQQEREQIRDRDREREQNRSRDRDHDTGHDR